MAWGELLDSSTLGTLRSTASAVSPAQWCQAFFLVAAAGVLTVAAAPREARSLMADYGARKSPDGGQPAEVKITTPKDLFTKLVAAITSFGQIPHSWFSTFYIISFACSSFWLQQYITDGPILGQIASRQAAFPGPATTLAQTATVWTMMLLQAGRRLYEHLTIIRPSKSTMWFVPWVLGLGFYLFMSVSIWVEGSRTLVAGNSVGGRDSLLKILLAIPLFSYAWVNQYRCHAHLARLKKYSLPDEGLFRRLVSPHYSCECLLYLSLAVAAAPQGQWFNRTLLCALVFVLVNLGVTAAGTREWYAGKFGPAAVVQKWNMIPFVF